MDERIHIDIEKAINYDPLVGNKTPKIKKSERGTHTKLITVHRGGKTFKRKQRVGRKESKKGQLPNYHLMPNNINILKNNIEKMNQYANESLKINKEICAPINIDKNEIIIGDKNIGENSKCALPKCEALGLYHTHQYKNNVMDTFSINDILIMLKNEINLSIIQTISNEKNSMWVAIKSKETINLNKNNEKDINSWSMVSNDLKNSYKTTDKHWRLNIKVLCDQYKIKLYYGVNGNLKEYKGDW